MTMLNTLSLWHDESLILLDTFGWAILHSLWQLTVVGLAVVVLNRLLSKQSPESRHLVFCLALVTMVLLPAGTLMTHVVHVPATNLSVLGDGPHPADSPDGAERGEPENTGSVDIATRTVTRDIFDQGDRGYDQVTSQRDQRTGSAAASVPSTSIQHALPWLATAWVAGVVLLSAWQLTGWSWLQWCICFRSRPVTEETERLLSEYCQRLGLRRRLRVLESSFVRIPCIAGWWRPVVLLPVEVVTGLPVEHVSAILMHELVHIRRSDALINGLQTVAETLLFYHPAVWWLTRQIRCERENCVDDMVVATLGDRLAYARALTAVAETCRPGSSSLVAADGGELKRRIVRILGTSECPEQRPRQSAWVPTLVSLLLLPLLLVNALPAQVSETVADETSKAINQTAETTEPVASAAQDADNTLASPQTRASDDSPDTSPPAKESLLVRDARRAVEHGVQFLKSQQQDDGSWAYSARNTHLLQGSTALATLALLKAGVPIDDPVITSAMKFLRSQETDYIYALSLKTLVWLSTGGEDVRVRSNIARLVEAQVKKGLSAGSWGYRVIDGAGARGDNSNMWFAVNALATAQATEFEVDPEVWTRLIRYLRESQHGDGGWNYVPKSSANPTGSMTCAGLGSMMRAMELAEVDDELTVKARTKAQDWLGRHFSVATNPGGGRSWHLYSLMAMRYAVGQQKQRFIGERDWFREGVAFLYKQQSRRDGSWRGNVGAVTPNISTSMALLFLCPLDEPALSYEESDEANRRSTAASQRAIHRALTQQIPVAGQVIATKTSKSGQELVEVSIGSDDGVRPNATIRLFHADRTDQPIAVIQVALVTPERCVGFVVEREKGAVIGIADIARLAVSPPKPGKQISPPASVNGAVLATKRRGEGREFVEISAGSDDGLRVGTRMHVFRKVDRRKVYLGQIRIELVTPHRSVGVVLMRARGQVIGIDDQVSTKLDVDAAASLLDDDSLLNALDGTIAPGDAGPK